MGSLPLIGIKTISVTLQSQAYLKQFFGGEGVTGYLVSSILLPVYKICELNLVLGAEQ